MKTVLLFRHAKSDWNADYDDDHDRPLAPRGKTAASMMGEYLARVGEIPDLVITSSALRATLTAKRAMKAGRWNCAATVSGELYTHSSEEVLRAIRDQDDSVESLLLVGHEPAWCELAAALIGGGTFGFPTAAMARIDFAADSWQEVGPGDGVLIWYVTPKLIDRLGL